MLDGVQLGGQTDRVVVVDETFFTKKKKNTGGFVGRTTLGHKTIVMGFWSCSCLLAKPLVPAC